MRIQWSEEKIQALKSALDNVEDAQQTGPEEYVVDLYDAEPPLTLELAFEGGQVRVLAAETMAYDQQMDGWYLAGPVDDGAAVEKALEGLL